MSRREAPMAVFVGTTPNIGTTTAAFAVAYRLAENGVKSIGFLCLNLKSAKLHRFLGIDEPEMTLDKLQPELRSSALTADMLLAAGHAVPERPNLRILFGNLNREGAEFVGAEDIEHLLEVAMRSFSFVVLDVGAYWDNAATVCCIRKASTRIVVTTPALSHFQEDGRRWIKGVSPLFNVLPNQYDCIIVHPFWGKGGYDMKEICKELGSNPMGEFHISESMLGGLDKGIYDDWLRNDSVGKAAMRKPAAILAQRYGLFEAKTVIARQPWYRKLLSHRNGVSSS